MYFWGEIKQNDSKIVSFFSHQKMPKWLQGSATLRRKIMHQFYPIIFGCFNQKRWKGWKRRVWVETNLFALFFRNLYLESFHLHGIVIVLSWSTMLVLFCYFFWFVLSVLLTRPRN